MRARRPPEVLHGLSLLTDEDLYLFNEGSHFRLYEKLGAHPGDAEGSPGCRFAVWAPNAEAVSVIGDFNGWDPARHRLAPLKSSGIWEGFLPGVGEGAVYKYALTPRGSRRALEKADPFAFQAELPPRTASVTARLDHRWRDSKWMKGRAARNARSAPISVYELHLGSWRRVPEEGGRSLSYRELAPRLIAYLRETGFTHVEFLPLTEHPFYGSWGYQSTGYFAPTRRYGEARDLMFLVDELHRAGFGVILDWVPSHFPKDEFALARFDGTCLYEHADPRKGWHPDWDSMIFNYGRHEVRSFLGSSALFWLDRYHADALRVDAVASMLYLDYSRKEGEWLPNEHGGRENLEAISFLRRLNEEAYRSFPDAQTIAEESTAWPGVSKPTYLGGLGFGFKWDMGWMHDTLKYLSKDPIHRKYHHGELTFRMIYAFHENFMLPLSHDEVVHGKGSLLGRMPGDERQRLANLRLLYGYMWGLPGKKLLFMGGELAQVAEWDHESSVEWHLEEHERHLGVRRWVADLNRLYRSEPALHALDCEPAGFEWVEADDAEHGTLAFLRKGGGRTVLVVLNLTPVPRPNHKVGVPVGGRWVELLNGDAAAYGGTGRGNRGGVEAASIHPQGRPWGLSLELPPLAALFLGPEPAAPAP